MAQRVFFLNTLKDGVDTAAYEEWIRRRDYPVARAQPAILSYVVARLEGHVVDGAELPASTSRRSRSLDRRVPCGPGRSGACCAARRVARVRRRVGRRLRQGDRGLRAVANDRRPRARRASPARARRPGSGSTRRPGHSGRSARRSPSSSSTSHPPRALRGPRRGLVLGDQSEHLLGALRVARQPPGALDRLVDVRDDPASPATHLVAEDAQPPGPATATGPSATTPRSAPLRPQSARSRSRSGLPVPHLERRVIEVACRPPLQPGRDHLEDASAQPHAVSARPEREPVQVDAGRGVHRHESIVSETPVSPRPSNSLPARMRAAISLDSAR